MFISQLTKDKGDFSEYFTWSMLTTLLTTFPESLEAC